MTGSIGRLGGGAAIARAIAILRVSLLVAVAGALLLTAPPARAAEVIFEPPSAEARLGQPVRFSTRFHSGVRPKRVEVLLRLPRQDAVSVQQADVTSGAGRYAATAVREGHTLPNTTFRYRFRVTTATGVVLGPEATVTVRDESVQWKVLEGRLVRLHWHEGGDAFARRALDIAEKAVTDVSRLLGVTETEPIDFFVYGSQTAFRSALGPGTRENVGGQANAGIRTLFALIEPSEINSSWVESVIPHELAHLVFDTAVQNPYHFPPHWLNEGLAVYLSEGYTTADRRRVRAARDAGDLIPLDGLAAQFPTTREGFFLAYAESVSAVDFFIRRYGREKLVTLVRSYARGITDNEAFTAATGADAAAFNAAWLADVGVKVPRPYGPRPGPPGPVPVDWKVAPATPAPDLAGPGGADGTQEAPDDPAATRSLGEGSTRPELVAAVAAVLVALVALATLATVRRGRRPRHGGG